MQLTPTFFYLKQCSGKSEHSAENGPFFHHSPTRHFHSRYQMIKQSKSPVFTVFIDRRHYTVIDPNFIVARRSESCGFTACLSHVLLLHGHYNLVQHIKFHAEWDLISSKSYISTRSVIFIQHTAGSYFVFMQLIM